MYLSHLNSSQVKALLHNIECTEGKESVSSQLAERLIANGKVFLIIA